jgi:CRP/FNR family transcriptional regulator, anaerobic regulatory protein
VPIHARTSCLACAVRQTALCHVLSPQQLASLNRRSFRKRYATGQLISGVSATEEWYATIVSGVIKLIKALPDGRQQIVALLLPSDFLGRPFKATSPYVAEAATTVELCCYSARDFERLLAEQANLKQLFLERALDAVDAARDWMLLLGRKNAREKVAAFLLMIARGGGSRACGAPDQIERIELPLSRTEMADYLALRLETVSRQLNWLEAVGVVKRLDRRGMAICNVGELERISGSDTPNELCGHLGRTRRLDQGRLEPQRS